MPPTTSEVPPHGEDYDVPDGWEWNEVDVVCEACGATNTLHEQPPEWLEITHPVAGNRLGVNWECAFCSAKNNIGGEPALPPDTHVVECVECHSTFAPSDVVDPATGEWTCPVCDTGPQRDVLAHEIVSSTTTGTVQS